MDANDTTSITETTAAAAPFDIAAARKELETAKTDVAQRERAILEEELRLAETAHADLLEKCASAQREFDELDRAVEAQHHVFLQSLTRRNGASAQLDAEQRNTQTPGWDHGRVVSGEEQAARQARIAEGIAGCKAADAEHARELAKMSDLQGKRRVAVQELERLSWEASPAAVRVAELKKKFAALTPRIIPAVAPPWTPPEIPESLVLEFSDGGLRPVPDAIAPKFR